MPLRSQSIKAKQHVLLDVPMSDVLQPVPDTNGKQSAGTKVLITLGPSCQSVEVLARMLEAGVTCARIELTWGSMDYHRRSLHNLNTAMQQTRRLCSVWLDTVGREMVVRRELEAAEEGDGFPNHKGGPLQAQKGQSVVITTDQNAVASPGVFPINYPSFPQLVDEGQVLQVGRWLATGAEGGSLFLKVMRKGDVELECEALNDAVLDGLLTVMICHRSDVTDSRADLELPLLTQHDVACIQTFGQEFEIDFISLSYCNSASDVFECRALLDSLNMLQTKIIAKVERKAALRSFTDIVAAADGVIFSRGNLGLDIDAEQMALLQKRCISMCNAMGKPVILTRIVDTMVNSPRPTRAEATDVANAVLDGADGVMLGAETLRGAYPVETCATVLRVAHSAEAHFDYRRHGEALAGEREEFAMDTEEEGNGLLPPSADMALASGLSRFGLSPTVSPTHGRTAFGGSFSSTPNLQPFQSDSARANGSASLFGPSRGGGAVGPGADGDLPPLPKPLSPPRYTSSFGNLQMAGAVGKTPSREALQRGRVTLSRVLKLESMALSATRTAEKINAGLIVVMTQSGRTASLVAKYRPPMPILAVVVPTLKSDGLSWQLEGKFLARQCLVIRGVVPMLAAPMSEGSDDLLSEAIFLATHQRLAKPGDYVVCILSHGGDLAVKVVKVNKAGTGIQLMEEHANQLVTGADPDLVGLSHPAGRPSPFVTCPGSMTPRVSSFRDGPSFSFRGAGPLVMTNSDAHAVLADTSMVRGGAGGFASPTRGEGLQLVGSPGSAGSAGSDGSDKPAALGGVLPMLGRRPSSVLAKYGAPGLPPLPPGPFEQ